MLIAKSTPAAQLQRMGAVQPLSAKGAMCSEANVQAVLGSQREGGCQKARYVGHLLDLLKLSAIAIKSRVKLLFHGDIS